MKNKIQTAAICKTAKLVLHPVKTDSLYAPSAILIFVEAKSMTAC